jgi:hypothetical protein
MTAMRTVTIDGTTYVEGITIDPPDGWGITTDEWAEALCGLLHLTSGDEWWYATHVTRPRHSFSRYTGNTTDVVYEVIR